MKQQWRKARNPLIDITELPKAQTLAATDSSGNMGGSGAENVAHG